MGQYIILESDSTSIYKNLAIEEYLLNYIKNKNLTILFLWQNRDCVVIGKHQNAFQECNTDLLYIHKVDLARRITGGGAVFHDIGNLNFSIITSASDYNKDKSMLLIQEALQSCGFPTELSGRNDILIGDKKISGNAYFKDCSVGLHHGTLLVHCDLEKMDSLLNADMNKMARHGVRSVKSRVMNLNESNPEVTINTIKSAITDGFISFYGDDRSHSLHMADLYEDSIFLNFYEKYLSNEWNYGKELSPMRYHKCSFDWGTAEIGYLLENGVLTSAILYTDYINPVFINKFTTFLENKKIEDLKNNDFWDNNLVSNNEADLTVKNDLFIFLTKLLSLEMDAEGANGI